MADPVTHIDVGPLRFVARHPTLVDFSDALRRSLEGDGRSPIAWRDQSRPVTVHVGLRDLFGVLPPRRGVRIGIQTEQGYDHDGQSLWGRQGRWRLLKYLSCYDAVLDLSEANRPQYARVPSWLMRRVHFGPFIFPRARIPFCAGEGAGAVFFGTPNARRGALIEALDAPVRTVAPKTYGAQVADAMREASTVLNVHYQAGVYAEYPRLLLAYLAGKPVMSEPLGAPFKPGDTYIPLGAIPDEANRRAIYERFCTRVAMPHRFVDFLARVGVCEAEPVTRDGITP